MVVKRGFSLYDIEQFLKEAGAEKVTEDAVLDLEKELERLCDTITSKAITYAEHAGRNKLIKEEDVLLAEEFELFDYSSPENFNANAMTTKRASKAVR